MAAQLAAAGCVAAEEEAAELIEAAAGSAEQLGEMVARRVTGEPLAWVLGWVGFYGQRVAVAPGIYVPRAQTAVLVAAAVEVLPGTGRAVDLCTGSGSVAMALAAARPGAEVVGVDIDPVACAGATANGVAAYCGDLDAALPGSWRATADVVTAVAPYVPTSALAYLPRDARDFEPGRALDGGEDGLAVVRRVVGAAARLLRPGGALVLELGGEQDEALAPDLAGAGFGAAERFVDEDGDLRAVRSILGGAPS